MITRIDRFVSGNYRKQIDWSGPISGGIGGLFSVFGNLFGANQQRKENQRNRQFAHDEAVLAHQRNLEIMDKTNEWNSPANQRKLLEQAGFNPNALFQNGGTVGRGAGSSGAAQASNPSQGSVGHPLLDPSMITALSQASLNEAQAKKTEAETGYVNEQKIGQSISNSLDKIRLGLEKQFADTRYKLELQNLDWNIAKQSAETSLLKINTELGFDELARMRPLQAMNVVADTTVKSTQSLVNQALHAKTEQDRKNSIQQLFATLNLTASQVALNYANARKANVDSDNWSPGSGVLWHVSNNDKWLGKHNVNTSTLEQGIYQTFLKQFKSTILQTYGNRAYSDLFQSGYSREYNYLLNKGGWSTIGAHFLQNPNTGNNPGLSTGVGLGASVLGTTLRKAILKF